MAGRGTALALAILTVVMLLAPSVVAGPVGGGDPPPSPPPSGGDPPGLGPGSGGAGAGPSGAGSGGPTPPPHTTYSKPSYKVPYADLRVKLLRADRETVAPSQVVSFAIETENVGYLTANLANLTLYNNVISGGTAIAWTDMDMRDFQGKTVLTWTATGLGDHTIIAFVDANNAVKEISETNNTASVVVHVLAGGGPGVPDIMLNERDIGLNAQPQAGQPTTLKVEIRNIGNTAANNVAVSVRDNGATIDSYTIGTLSTTTSNVRSITWTPAAEGPHILNVTADEGGTIRELSEDNNFASTGVGVKPIQLPGCIMNKGEWVINNPNEPPYTNCLIFATNVTVNTILRLLGNTRLWVGRLYGIPVGGSVFPRPLPNVAWHNLKINSGGILVVTGSTITTWQATYAYGFEAKVGSAFYMNATSYAYFPWGRWPVPLAVGQHVGEVEGGLIVRTNAFSFKGSAVISGRLHGLFLDGVVVPTPGLQGDTFKSCRGAGLVGRKAADAAVTGSTFQSNAFGFYQKGQAPSTISKGRVGTSVFQANTVGIDSDTRSSINVTGNPTPLGFINNLLMAVRLRWEVGTPARTDPIVSNFFLSNPFGVYALGASPEIRSNTFNSLLPSMRTHATLDQSVYVSQSGQEWPRVTGNLMTAIVAAPLEGIAVNAYSTNVLIGGSAANKNTMRIPQGVSCIAATCRVQGNAIGDGLGKVCWGVGAVAQSTLSWTAGNSIANVGCTSWGILVDASAATIRDGLIGQSETLLTANWATSLSVINVTFSDLDPTTTGASKIAVNASHGALFDVNHILNAPLAILNSMNLVFRGNDQRSDIGDGMELDNATNALVENNVFESPFFYPPQSPPITQGQRDKGHVKVYNNSTATVRWNTMKNGSWGVSLDDCIGPSQPCTKMWRSTYALIDNNTISRSGYVAIGVDTTTRADVRYNRVDNSTGFGIQMESGYVSNTVYWNWLNTTHGIIDASCAFSAILLSREDAPGGIPKIGDAVVSLNRLLDTNHSTGIRVCHDRPAYVHNNTVDNVGRLVEAGITLQPATKPIRVHYNTVRGYEMGIWVKNKGAPTPSDPGHDLGWNTLTANKEGIRIGIGDVPNGYAWADIHHNTIASNTVSGINVSAAVDGLSLYSSHAKIHDLNVISGSVYGIRIQVWVNRTDVPTTIPPYAIVTRNTIQGNTYGAYLKGILFSGNLHAPWANLTGNNTITSNTYGVWIDGPTVDPTANHFWMWWNDARDNTNQGVYVQGDPQGQWGNNVFFRAYCNWWKDTTGPNDASGPLPLGPPDYNPTGLGQSVSDYFHYRSEPSGPLWWLKSPAQQATTCSP